MTKKLIVAGGGTGGHIFPGLAIAKEWQKRQGEALFVGTPRGQEKDLIPKYGYRLHLLNVSSLKGSGIFQKIKTILGLPKAIFQAFGILKQENPDLVLGIGGYASFPTVLAAFLKGIPTAITDQNMHPGMTNRFLGKLVKKVFVSFEDAEPFFPAKKTTTTGNPVRSKIKGSDLPDFKGRFQILIFGGSQGAVSMNKAFTEALLKLKDQWENLEIIHQSGKTDLPFLQSFYKEHKISAHVGSFFHNMNELYEKSHLVIARSGAGTVTELALSGRPSILVPYPFASDNHQVKNALFLSRRQAAILMEQKDLTPEKLESQLRELLKPDLTLLKNLAQNALQLAKPKATQDLVDGLESLV